MVESILECPVCGKKSLEIRSAELEIPHFGIAFIFTEVCTNCGYRTNDIRFEGKFPRKDSVRIENSEDLKIKVVRGNEGRVEIPELGLILEPGPNAESFITNIEGLLERFSEIIKLFDKDKIADIEEKIEKAKNGELAFTILLDDPTGVSHFIKEDNQHFSTL